MICRRFKDIYLYVLKLTLTPTNNSLFQQSSGGTTQQDGNNVDDVIIRVCIVIECVCLQIALVSNHLFLFVFLFFLEDLPRRELLYVQFGSIDRAVLAWGWWVKCIGVFSALKMRFVGTSFASIAF